MRSAHAVRRDEARAPRTSSSTRLVLATRNGSARCGRLSREHPGASQSRALRGHPLLWKRADARFGAPTARAYALGDTPIDRWKSSPGTLRRSCSRLRSTGAPRTLGRCAQTWLSYSTYSSVSASDHLEQPRAPTSAEPTRPDSVTGSDPCRHLGPLPADAQRRMRIRQVPLTMPTAALRSSSPRALRRP
jgi:hypothetical protein